MSNEEGISDDRRRASPPPRGLWYTVGVAASRRHMVLGCGGRAATRPPEVTKTTRGGIITRLGPTLACALFPHTCMAGPQGEYEVVCKEIPS